MVWFGAPCNSPDRFGNGALCVRLGDPGDGWEAIVASNSRHYSTRWPTHWIICYLLHRGLMELLRPYYLLSVMVFIQRRTTVRWSWFSSRSHWGKRWSRWFYWYDGEHLPSATELWVLLEMVPSEKQGISESWWWTLPVQVSSRIAR